MSVRPPPTFFWPCKEGATGLFEHPPSNILITGAAILVDGCARDIIIALARQTLIRTMPPSSLNNLDFPVCISDTPASFPSAAF